MPSICTFYGIVIYMYYNDHNPPHFHAEYAEFEAVYMGRNFRNPTWKSAAPRSCTRRRMGYLEPDRAAGQLAQSKSG